MYYVSGLDCEDSLATATLEESVVLKILTGIFAFLAVILPGGFLLIGIPALVILRRRRASGK